MGNPNPFYRFETGWNSGFYPDNQIVSDLLNEVYSAINTALPTIAVIGTTTLNQLKASVKGIVDVFNEYPYYGNFNVKSTIIFVGPDYNYTITVRDDGLYATDNSQELTITGTTDGSKVLLTASLASFTPGAYTATFDAPLIDVEKKVQEALNVVDLNGSALFPITYKFDPTTDIATSGLARGKNWKLDNGSIQRLPPAQNPYKNQRTFQLPQLSGDDAYIISIIERIIEFGFSVNLPTGFTDFFNSIQTPVLYSKNFQIAIYTTYPRVQFTFTNNLGRQFTLVGRKDGDWLWQRFVTDDGFTTPDIFSIYNETTPLPYEPNIAGRWLYQNNPVWYFYDFEFVEFTSGCFESKEFYPMPAKPGDQFQFNVVDGNLTGIDEVSVGLFTESGDFIQKIGEATREQRCCCNQYVFTREYSAAELDLIRFEINANIGGDDWRYYFFISNGTDVIQSVSQPMPSEFITTPSELDAYFSQFSGQFLFSVNITGSDWETASGTITITTLTMNCDEPVLYMNEQFANEFNPIIPSTVTGFTITSGGCDNIDLSQFYASVTIPSKKGCYRMGLYNEPISSCELTFEYVLEAEALESYIISVNEIASSLFPYLGFSIDGVNFIYTELTTASYTAETLSAFINANITGITTDVYFCNPPSALLCMSFTYTQTVECGDDTYALINQQTADNGVPIGEPLFTSESQTCECGSTYSLYSLSNIINIDASDCFSTMLEFWADSNSVAQGMEYYGNWKQRVRIGLNGGGEKPVFEESLYRQSNGVHRRPQNKQDLSLDLHTDFFDLDTQLAMTDATRHPYLIWEGKSIFVKGDIEVATIQDFTTQSSFETLSQMKFQALIQGFQPRNSSCLTC
jgi:hypothetical protein